MTPSQISPASNPPKANRTASGMLTDTPLPGSSTERSRSKIGISPSPSNASQMRSTGCRAAHSPGSSAQRQARQRRDHARRGQPARQRRRVARHRDGRDADGQRQRAQGPDPPPGRWMVVLPAPVCNPPQDPIDRGVDHHHGTGGDQPRHPVAAPGHGVEGLRQGDAAARCGRTGRSRTGRRRRTSGRRDRGRIERWGRPQPARVPTHQR